MKPKQFEEFLRKRGKSHIIFDFDETIATIQIDWDKWIEEISLLLKGYDPQFDSKKVAMWSESENQFVSRFGKKIQREMSAFNAVFERTHIKGIRKNEAALGIVSHLTSVTCSLWTSNSQGTIVPLLHELRLEQTFDPIVTRDHVTYLKPHHEGFSIIHNKHQLALDKYLFIGDSEADEGAARTSGIDFLHVSELE